MAVNSAVFGVANAPKSTESSAYSVNAMLITATTNTDHSGRNETEQTSGTASSEKKGRINILMPPCVVNISTTGKASAVATTINPATVTIFNLLHIVVAMSAITH